MLKKHNTLPYHALHRDTFMGRGIGTQVVGVGEPWSLSHDRRSR
jgi:hypothetical protein